MANHYILPLWFLLSFFFFLFSSPVLSGHRLDVYHTSTHDAVLVQNIEYRSEMCSTWLAKNTGCKKLPKIRQLRTIAPLCRAISSQLRCVSTFGKNLLNSNISSTCPHNMVNFGPRTAEIGSGVWGTQQISTGFASWLRYCSDVAHRRPTKLCMMFGHLLGCYTINRGP